MKKQGRGRAAVITVVTAQIRKRKIWSTAFIDLSSTAFRTLRKRTDGKDLDWFHCFSPAVDGIFASLWV